MRRACVGLGLGLVLALAVTAAGCGGDKGDDQASSASTVAPLGGGATSTTAPSGPTTTFDPSRPECQQLTVLLKPDVTSDQRKAVEAKLKDIDQVATFTFQKATAQSQDSPRYLVKPTSLDQLQVVGDKVVEAGLPGVASVVYPRQIC